MLAAGNVFAKDNPMVKFETSEGTFTAELYADKAPITVDNFMWYVDNQFYDGLIFHRVIKDFMVQGGDPSGDGSGGPGYEIDDEPSALALPHERGSISMANSGPDTGGSQFFICVDRESVKHLDGKHAVFGMVVSGMNVVDTIIQVDADPSSGRPYSPVHMTRVYIKGQGGP